MSFCAFISQCFILLTVQVIFGQTVGVQRVAEIID